MLSAAILGITAMLLALQLKGVKSELGIYVALAATVILFSYGVDKLSVVLAMADRLTRYLSIPSAYLQTLFKMVGITYICEFASALCRDGGYQSIAAQLETFGKLSIMAVSAPVILSLFETIESLLG